MAGVVEVVTGTGEGFHTNVIYVGRVDGGRLTKQRRTGTKTTQTEPNKKNREWFSFFLPLLADFHYRFPLKFHFRFGLVTVVFRVLLRKRGLGRFLFKHSRQSVFVPGAVTVALQAGRVDNPGSFDSTLIC